MFYCDDCRIKNDWPQSWLSRWRGTCEVCKKFSENMNDVHHSRLTTVKEGDAASQGSAKENK